jgi:hypothetical protein
MKLVHLKQRGVADLYPPLITRSGREIITTEATLGDVGAEGLPVTIKVLFPPSDLRRTELIVREEDGELRVSPVEPTRMVDAQRFAQMLLERGHRDDPHTQWAPLRTVKDAGGRLSFSVGVAATTPGAPAPSDAPVVEEPAPLETPAAERHAAAERPSRPSTPIAKRATSEKGGS